VTEGRGGQSSGGPRLLWDEAKRTANLAKHGVDFVVLGEFEWSVANIFEDRRRPYGEARFVAHAPIRGRLHVVVFTHRDDLLRIISLRKANSREIRAYGQKADPVDP
jgi:uncharacterized DUF497 family protein